MHAQLQPEDNAVLGRIQVLEVRCRRNRIISLCAIGLLMGALIMGQAKSRPAGDSNVLRAHKFVVLDAGGKERAVFGFAKLSDWGDYFVDKKDKPVPGLFLSGAEAGNSIALALGSSEGKTIPLLSMRAMFKKHGSDASMKCSPDDALVRLSQDNSVVLLESSNLNKKAGPFLLIKQEPPNCPIAFEQVFLGMQDDRSWGLRLSRGDEVPKYKSPYGFEVNVGQDSTEERHRRAYFEAQNKARAITLSLTPSGEPSLMLNDRKGQIRTAIGAIGLVEPKAGTKTQRSASSIVLFGEDGKLMWSMPR